MFTTQRRYTSILILASLILSNSSHAAITESFKLTAPVEFSEEGTYLTTNKGDFVLQTLIINPRVFNTIQTLKRGNCFSVTSTQGLSRAEGSDISKISKLKCTR